MRGVQFCVYCIPLFKLLQAELPILAHFLRNDEKNVLCISTKIFHYKISVH